MTDFPGFRRTLLRIVPLLAVACATAAPAPRGVTLLECRAAPNEAFASAVVDQAGDALHVRGHRFRLPPGAVRGRERFRVTDRRTANVGVDIVPHGYRFARPAEITLSYAACDDVPADAELVIVEVRPGTTIPVGDPLESKVDRQARTVTASIEHLSGYLIGSNRTE